MARDANPFVDALVHRWLPFARTLHVQYLDQRFDGDALQEHGKVNDGNGRREEHGLQRDMVHIDQ